VHTKIATRLKVGLLIVVLAVFYSFVGYTDYAKNNTKAATAQIETKVAEVEQQSVKDGTYYGIKRAEIALAEYNKGIFEDVRGCNCGVEVNKYTEGMQAPWCAMFASWVTKEAGSPVYSDVTKSWRITNSRDLSEYLKKTGTWYSRDDVISKDIQPRLGDFVIFYRGDFEDKIGHVDIVVRVDDSKGFAGLVGGNVRDRVEFRDLPYEQNYGFLGFGRPEKD
jgi:hypothetical protein